MKSRPNKVLVAPLDWGLGHATRCIPVIRELLRQKTDVLICASGNGKIILKNYFPECSFIEIPGINIKYPQNGSMAFSMLYQLPAILKAIKKEHQLLAVIIALHNITHIISDNRYGLYHKTVKCSMICHQLKIKTPDLLKFLESLLFRIHKKRIQKFNELWIPDNPYPDNLSGELSHPAELKIPVKHIGILSRFKNNINAITKTYDYIAITSGPEPQRTLLEMKLLLFFNNSGKKCLLIAGKPGENKYQESKMLTVQSSITDNLLMTVLHPETTLICRPGYSTLMDLTFMEHRKIIFIPTPGQTEQEYLGRELKSVYSYTVIEQHETIPGHTILPGKPLPGKLNSRMLENIIKEFLS